MGLSFSEGVHAPWLQLPDRETILMSHNALKAHGRAVQELRAHARQPLVIGYAPTSGIALPATDKPEDIEAARQAYFGIPQEGTWAWNTAWWSDPVIFGKYPEEFLVHFEKDLPKITDDDMKLISEPIDIYGQNIYLGYPVCMGEDGKPELLSRNGLHGRGRKAGAPEPQYGLREERVQLADDAGSTLMGTQVPV